MTNLHDLFDKGGQSPWIDNLKRSYIEKGELQELIDSGIRGLTSNPSILEKAITGGTDYDDQFTELAQKYSPEDSFWEMAIQDVSGACDVFKPLFDSSGGNDGFVSLEVSPALALESKQTEDAARDLHKRVNKPNLMVKIPATEAGLAPIQQMISEGRSINVTLIFGIERYEKVIDAYIDGVEAYAATGATDLDKINSVASFFISRVDTETDKRLDAIGTDEAKALKGKAAVAQAVAAYDMFKNKFSGPRWEALAAKGAKVQRPLWASTSTKNPDYPDTLYVDALIGPDTVNTMPDTVADKFLDHGTVARTIDADVEGAKATLKALADLGVDIFDVGVTLENEGVASFVKSYDDLLQVLADKHEALREAAQ